MQGACNENNKKLKEDFQGNQNAARREIFLGLQGGGSHGAFEAGVIQALQEADILKDIKGISGVSAGAFNAAPLSYALNAGKPELAPSLLREAWNNVACDAKNSTLTHNFARSATHYAPFLIRPIHYPNLPTNHLSNMESMGQLAQFFGVVTQSGDIKNRMNSAVPNWDVIKKGPIQTFIGASKVKKSVGGAILSEKIFRNPEIDADAIAASATLIGTHSKGGEEYIDGGYVFNPPLQPALNGKYTDLLVVMLSKQPDGPLTPLTQKVQINGVEFLHDEVYNELAKIRRDGKINVHVIEMEHEPHWDDTSKMNAEPKWINELYARGLSAGREWVAKHEQDLGKTSTFNPFIHCGKCDLDKRVLAVA